MSECSADTAVGWPGMAGAALQASWRGCAGCWHSLGAMLCPAFGTWPCEPAFLWADNSLPAESGSWDIRCPFLSFLIRAVPLCFPLPCHKHGRKQTLQGAEGARPAPCEPSARNGEVEVIPQRSQEVPLKSPVAALPCSSGPAGSIPRRISHRVFPACPSRRCPAALHLPGDVNNNQGQPGRRGKVQGRQEHPGHWDCCVS